MIYLYVRVHWDLLLPTEVLPPPYSDHNHKPNEVHSGLGSGSFHQDPCLVACPMSPGLQGRRPWYISTADSLSLSLSIFLTHTHTHTLSLSLSLSSSHYYKICDTNKLLTMIPFQYPSHCQIV